jgi:lysophospholipase L1-like esterase
VIAAISLVLVAGLGEMILRVRCTYCDWSERNGGAYKSHFEQLHVDSQYHTHGPDQIRTYDQPEFDHAFSTNSLGIRDERHPIGADEGEFRLIGLGDSFTEGQGAAFEDTYLKALERNLNDWAASEVRVIVGGVAGSDPLYAFNLLRDELLDFDPDLVLLAVNVSDVFDLMVRGGVERFTPDGRVRFNKRPRVEALYRWSHLYRLVMMRFLGYDWFGFSAEEQVERRARAIEDLKSVLDAFQQLAENRGFELLVVLHPMLWELASEDYNFDAEALMKHMASQQIPFVDLMGYFGHRVPKEGVESLYWSLDGHHNAAGYKLFAEGLEETIRGLGLIDRKR